MEKHQRFQLAPKPPKQRGRQALKPLMLGLLLTSGLAGATGLQALDTIRTNLCTNAIPVITSPLLVGVIAVFLIAWAGYSFYLGKRDAVDIVTRVIIGTIVVTGAVGIAAWFGSSCS